MAFNAYAKCCYAECDLSFVAIMLSVVKLNVVAPTALLANITSP
jgi:hypothetical protein